MLAAGMGAGIGAIFRAPLAGALFAAEILYSTADLESEVLLPSAIASIIAYSVYELCLPVNFRFVPVFGNKLNYAISSPLELLPLFLLAVILTLAAIGFVESFYGTHRLFKKLPISRYLCPPIGAGLAGIVALILYLLTGFDSARWRCYPPAMARYNQPFKIQLNWEFPFCWSSGWEN